AGCPPPGRRQQSRRYWSPPADRMPYPHRSPATLRREAAVRTCRGKLPDRRRASRRHLGTGLGTAPQSPYAPPLALSPPNRDAIHSFKGLLSGLAQGRRLNLAWTMTVRPLWVETAAQRNAP